MIVPGMISTVSSSPPSISSCVRFFPFSPMMMMILLSLSSSFLLLQRNQKAHQKAAAKLLLLLLPPTPLSLLSTFTKHRARAQQCQSESMQSFVLFLKSFPSNSKKPKEEKRDFKFFEKILFFFLRAHKKQRGKFHWSNIFLFWERTTNEQTKKKGEIASKKSCLVLVLLLFFCFSFCFSRLSLSLCPLLLLLLLLMKQK